MEEQEKYIRALIELHQGLERQGPGDTDFSEYIISQIPELPTNPRIADIGCGTGAAALFLADKFRSKVRAVDLSRNFLDKLEKRAKQRGLEHLVEAIECDMGSLDWKPETIDLLWSEGAAYNLTFKGALKTWRPLMAANGVAVISEMSYFTSEVPESVRVYWQKAYPTIGTESENSNRANSLGFEISGIHRLPSKAWWDNYYGPLKENMKLLNKETIETIYEKATDILATVGVEFEMDSAIGLFKKNGAKVEGKRVFISPSLLTAALDSLPRVKYNPTHNKRLIAASPFSNAPMILDDLTGGFRQGNVQDAVKMYQLAETSDLYESINPGVVDPEGNDSKDPYIGQIAMMLKYSDKFPGLSIRATKSNTKNGDVYTSAKKAIQLIKSIKGDDSSPVMGQGICPLAPLSYDEESLINLTVLVEEEQDITIFPCTLSFMTGPESLLGIVVHDMAICLAGMVYIQLLKPGTGVSLSNFSTMSDMRTMQPVYGSPEFLQIQIMFYEVCLHLEMNCILGGCLSDGTRNDYQGGFESCFTSIAPYYMTVVDEIWCYPGLMAAFAGGSFKKMILDEELIINCNRTLVRLNLEFDPLLKDKLVESLSTKSFLTIGSPAIYRKEQRVSHIFNKKGIDLGNDTSDVSVDINVSKEIENRCAAYVLPDRSKAQINQLQRYLPTQCKY